MAIQRFAHRAAKLLGDLRYAPAATALVAQLGDPVPRARFFAAEALGRIAYKPAVAPLIAMLADNNDEDVYLRHAGATALARIGLSEPLVALSSHPSRGVRLAAIVALRRMRDAGVARFLGDQDPLVVTEAARAINDDGGIEGAIPAPAARLDSVRTGSDALVRRVINANLRVGTSDAARRVAAFAARASASDDMRAEAIAVLGMLAEAVGVLDRVDWIESRSSAARDTSIARSAIASLVEPMFASGTPAVQVALAEAIGRLRVTSASTILFERVRAAQSPAVRVASLKALASLHDERTEQAMRAALGDQDVTVRMAALSAIPALNLPEATTADLLLLRGGQGLGIESSRAQSPHSVRSGGHQWPRCTLTRLVDQLAQGKVAPDIQLDVADAARATKHAPRSSRRLDSLEKSRANAAPNVAYADAHFTVAMRGAERV